MHEMDRTGPMDEHIRCLLVDDEPRRLQAALAQLQALGHSARGCPEADAALALLAGESFDLLLVAGPPARINGVGLLREATLAHPDLLAAIVRTLPWQPDTLTPLLTATLALAQLKRENAALADTARAAQQRAQAAAQELDAFAGRISHDLQGVLQVTEGFANALQRTAAGKLDDKESHYLQRIIETNARGNQLVHDLLGFARLAAQPMTITTVDMRAVLEQARRTVAAASQDRQVEWTVSALPAVRGDALLLHQVFVHLLSNALKFTRGRPVARIRVDAMVTATGVEFQVHDNGAGFDAAQAARLFRPFERLHSAEEYEGNGMGLAHVGRIVGRHSGTVRAADTPDGGAMFAFTLPGPAEVPAAPAGTVSPEAAARSPALRVLVVDDDPMVLASLRSMLELDGHEVSGAPSGQAGRETFAESLRAGAPFDFVITDFGMPNVDGLDVARAVKASGAATRVIMLTGGATRDGGPAQWKGHVDRVLGKPPRLAQLREALMSLAGPVACTEGT
jgi:signal transduction histidine kinase/ActR/RegA family two-component response regulator